MTRSLSLPAGRHVYLIGPMGAGKTHWGRALAAAGARPFIDSDVEIEKQRGMSVAELFAAEGEAAFRELERAQLRAIADSDEAAVVATGGGAVLSKDNCERMRRSGVVIHLRAEPETLWRRLAGDTSRPLLQGGDPKRQLERIAQEREELYRQNADAEVDTDADPETMLDAIAEAARNAARS